jgi:hypothetical protein
MDLATSVGVSATSWGYYEQTGQKYNSNVLTAFGAPFASGAVIGIAVDASTSGNVKIWWSLNGTWQASGDPASGANPAFSGITGPIYLYCSLYRSGAPAHKVTLNAGASAFSGTVPSGFRAGLYQ